MEEATERQRTVATRRGLDRLAAHDARANSARPRPNGAGRGGWRQVLDGRGWIWLRLACDLLAGSLAVVLALLTGDGEPPWLFAFPLILAATLQLRGMYRRPVEAVVLDRLGTFAGAVSIACMALLVGGIFVLGDSGAGTAIGRIWAFGLVIVVLAHAILVRLQRHAHMNHLIGRPTLIVGAGDVGSRVARRLAHNPEYGLRPIGFLDADPHRARNGTPVLGRPEDLAEVATLTGAEHVIFAFTGLSDRGLLPLARRCDQLGLEVSLVPRFFESVNNRMRLERVGGFPLLALRAVDPKGWQFEIKYAVERLLVAVGIVVLAPLLAVVAAAVKLSSPGPVLFRQRRVGRDGQVFDLLKFRSMRLPEEEDDFQIRDGSAPGGVEGRDRRTAVGRFLRRSALDELPQLFNVLKGEMSLVGPRPERPEFADRFGRDLARYADRHRVKSGITGWAQVSGLRGQTSLEDRIEWDNHYIENWSPWFDVKVMVLTVGAVLRTSRDA